MCCDYGEVILKVKIKSVVKFVWGFLVSGCVFSFAQQTAYLNFTIEAGVGHLVQSFAPAKLSVETVPLESTAIHLNGILSNFSGNLSIDSDIDLGQINSAGKCIANHTPISFNGRNVTINGNGHVIKNLCADISITNPSSQGYRDTLGFFKNLDSVTVENLKFENVRFSIAEGATRAPGADNGLLYAGVGTLAGYIRHSTISNVSLTSVKLVSPFAGGIAGYVEKSTFKNITSTDPIEISNRILINNGVVGSGGNGAPQGAHSAVFLGGLVGFSYDLSIADVDISVSLRDEAGNPRAGIGGLVGQFGYTSEQDSAGKLIVENVKVGARENALLENGKMMGGFFGETCRLRNSGKGGDLVILNSSFNGKFSNAQGDTAYVGGFVGKNLLDKGGSIEVIKSQSNVDISDDLRNASPNYYYAGGLVAWGSSDINYSFKDKPHALISFVDSKVSGNINLVNSSSIGKNKVFVGGFAGYVPLAHNDSALFADTSTVKISVDMNNMALDSVGVGGFVGFLRSKSSPNDTALVNVQNSVYSGEISVKNTGSKTYAGGVIGVYWGADNPHALNVKNVFVTGQNLLNVSAAGAKVGGLCGVANSVASLDRVAVLGNIAVQGGADSVLAGGLMGGISGNSADFNWSNTYFIGNLDVVKSASNIQPLAGYLAGKLEAKGNGFKHVIRSNYHSGSDFVDAFGAFNGWQPGVTDWSAPDTQCLSYRPCWEVDHNVRNGDTESLNMFNNGVQTQKFIQSAYFADFLNENLAKRPWQQNASENNMYPFFDAGYTGAILPPSSSSFEVSSSSEASSSSLSSSSVSSSSVVSSSSRPWKWTMVSLSQFKKVSLKKKEILYWWDDASTVGEYLQYQAYTPENAGDGMRGYWMWSNRELPAKVSKPTDGKSFVWNLDSVYTGWNLVANPYGWSIDVADLGTDVQVWHCVDSIGDYDTTYVLDAYEGAWVHTGIRKTITVDATPVSLKKPAAAKRVVAEDPSSWSVSAILRDEYGKTDSRNIIGVGAAAERWAEPPSGMANDHVSLSIVEGKKRYAKSLKREGEDLQWTFQVKASSDRDGFLKFEGLEKLAANGKKIYMIDDGKVLEMNPGKSVRVALRKDSRNITVVASEKAPVVASRFVYDMHIDMTHSVNVGFNVVKNALEKPVRVSLVNALGREVYGTVISAKAGINQVEFALPQKGVYILSIKVGNDIASQKIAVR